MSQTSGLSILVRDKWNSTKWPIHIRRKRSYTGDKIHHKRCFSNYAYGGRVSNGYASRPLSISAH